MYKVKRLCLVVVLLMIACIFYGCSMENKMQPKEEKLQGLLNNLKTYEVDATITFLRESKSRTIKMKQIVEMGGRYKLIIEEPKHLKGYTISYNGESTIQYNPITQKTSTSKESAARNEVILSSFIQHYLEQEEVKLEEETLEGKKVTCIEITIPGDFKYMAKEKIWFDTATNEPIKMEIYDVEGHVAIQITFENFKYNLEIKWEA